MRCGVVRTKWEKYWVAGWDNRFPTPSNAEGRATPPSSNVRNCRNGQILFGGSGSKRDGGLNVLGFQAREIGKNLFGRISGSQAGEYGAQSDTRALENRFPAADSLVADDALFVVLQIAGVFRIAGCAAHGACLNFSQFILSSGAVLITRDRRLQALSGNLP
jgi:hypothetical protein